MRVGFLQVQIVHDGEAPSPHLEIDLSELVSCFCVIRIQQKCTRTGVRRRLQLMRALIGRTEIEEVVGILGVEVNFFLSGPSR